MLKVMMVTLFEDPCLGVLEVVTNLVRRGMNQAPYSNGERGDCNEDIG